MSLSPAVVNSILKDRLKMIELVRDATKRSSKLLWSQNVYKEFNEHTKRLGRISKFDEWRNVILVKQKVSQMYTVFEKQDEKYNKPNKSSRISIFGSCLKRTEAGI
jgi:hypothetical protein